MDSPQDIINEFAVIKKVVHQLYGLENRLTFMLMDGDFEEFSDGKVLKAN